MVDGCLWCENMYFDGDSFYTMSTIPMADKIQCLIETLYLYNPQKK